MMMTLSVLLDEILAKTIIQPTTNSSVFLPYAGSVCSSLNHAQNTLKIMQIFTFFLIFIPNSFSTSNLNLSSFLLCSFRSSWCALHILQRMVYKCTKKGIKQKGRNPIFFSFSKFIQARIDKLLETVNISANIRI